MAKLTAEEQRAIASLARVHGPAELARRIGASESAVRSWVKGERAPSSAARSALRTMLTKSGAKPRMGRSGSTSHQAAPANGARPPEPPSTSGALLAVTAREMAVDQVRELREDIARARLEQVCTRDLCSLQRALTSALRNLSRLTGELEITESQVMRSSAWTRIKRAVERVLEKHPEVARDLAIALQEMA